MKNLAWAGSVIAATAMAITFLYANFQTSFAANKFEDKMESRLERMEQKLDSILEK